MNKQENLFDYAIGKMRERGVFGLYGPSKTPKDAVDAGSRSLSSVKATQMRTKAFSDKDIVAMLNSPTYCQPVDAYVPFWWAVKHYPEAMFGDWSKRISMAAGLQKQQYTFQTTAQLFLNGATHVNESTLAEPDCYMDLKV